MTAMAALAQVQMNTGHKVSALLHGGLILWVLVFDLFEEGRWLWIFGGHLC